MSTTKATAEWGVKGSVSGASYGSGVVTDVQAHIEFSTSPELNEVGAVIQQAKYDEHWTGSATIQCKHSATLPKDSAQITLKAGGDSIQGYVTGCDIIESNQSYVKFQVSIEKYKNCNKLQPYE